MHPQPHLYAHAISSPISHLEFSHYLNSPAARYGALFEDFSGPGHCLFGLIQLIQKLAFSLMIALIGQPTIQSSVMTVIYVVEAIYCFCYSPHIDRAKNVATGLTQVCTHSVVPSAPLSTHTRSSQYAVSSWRHPPPHTISNTPPVPCTYHSTLHMMIMIRRWLVVPFYSLQCSLTSGIYHGKAVACG